MRKSLAFLLLLITTIAIAASCGKQLPTQSETASGLGRSIGAASLNTFCEYQIGNFVWNDLNEDGIQDAGEPGIPGVTVKLFNAADELLATVVTDANGEYRFYEVCEGSYRVEVTPPAGDCVPTKVNVGSLWYDSNPNPAFVEIKDAGDMSIDFGFVCKTIPPPECAACVGKVNSLELRYNGTSAATIKVMMKKPKVKVFEGTVQPGGVFSFVGADKKGTLGTEIIVYVNNQEAAKIHTSCSKPIGPGLVAGPFVVVSGTSKDGGPLCPLPPVPPPGEGDLCDTYGRPTVIAFTYTGDGCDATSHTQDASKVACSGDPQDAPVVRILITNNSSPTSTSALVWFDGTVNLGQMFAMSAANAGQTKMGTDSFAYVYVGGQLVQSIKFHTSCSQPLLRGDQYGSLRLEGFTAPGSGIHTISAE